jgi:hypothetical protein
MSGKSGKSSDGVRYWVAKVPEYMFQEWEKKSAENPDAVVGELTVPVPKGKKTYTGDEPPPKRCKLSVSNPVTEICTEYFFSTRDDYLPGARKEPEPYMLFSENPADPSANKLEAKPFLFADVVADTNNDEYKAMMKRKFEASRVKTSVTSEIKQTSNLHAGFEMIHPKPTAPVKFQLLGVFLDG